MSREHLDTRTPADPLALPARTRQLIRVASVLLDPFSISELATVLGQPERRVAMTVREAVASGVLSDGEFGLSFCSDTVRASVIADVGPTVLRALHRSAGRALAARGGSISRVVRHFELGAEPGDREAIEWLWRGAKDALSRSPDESGRLLRRALDLCISDADRAEASVRLAETLTVAGRADEAVAIALAALQRVHDPEVELRLVRASARAWRAAGRPAEAAAILTRTLDELVMSSGERALVLAAVANVLVLSGELGTGSAAARAGLDLARRTVDHAAASEAAAALSRSYLWVGDIQSAVEMSSSATRSALRSDDEWTRAEGRYLLAMHLMHADRFDESDAMFVELLGDGERIAERGRLTSVRGLGFVGFHRGRWIAARSHLLRSTETTAGRSVALDLVPALAILAAIDLARGSFRTTARLLVDAFDQVDRSGSPFSSEWPLWARALGREAERDLDAAARDVAAAIDAIEASGAVYRLRIFGPDFVRISVSAGRSALAVRVMEPMATWAGRSDVPSVRFAAQLCAGLAANDPDILASAARGFRQTERSAELAAASEATGLVLAVNGDPRGREHLVEALTMYDAMGAHRNTARVRSMLRAHGWRLGARGSRRRPSAGLGSLTQAEREVARLVAAGLTNRQIAATLFVSPRTAESHVGRVRAKLGAESRVAIANQLRSAGEDAHGQR